MTDKKTILVTGGNAGIGHALCIVLARRGCKVYLGSRSFERGALAVGVIKETLGADADVELVQIDVTSEDSVITAADRVKKRVAVSSS